MRRFWDLSAFSCCFSFFGSQLASTTSDLTIVSPLFKRKTRRNKRFFLINHNISLLGHFFGLRFFKREGPIDCVIPATCNRVATCKIWEESKWFYKSWNAAKAEGENRWPTLKTVAYQYTAWRRAFAIPLNQHTVTRLLPSTPPLAAPAWCQLEQTRDATPQCSFFLTETPFIPTRNAVRTSTETQHK